MARLLIVEDHPELASLMVAAAESRGHEATAVHTGEDALALLRPGSFHAAVVDLLLPDMRGSAVLSALRDQGIPAIAVSGVFKGDRFAREATEVYGARAFFEKPFELLHLLEAMEDLCGLTHLQPPPPPDDDDEVVVFEDAALLDMDDEPGFLSEDDEPVFGAPVDESPPVVQGLTLVEEVEDPFPGEVLAPPPDSGASDGDELPRPPSLEVSLQEVEEATAEPPPPSVEEPPAAYSAPPEPEPGYRRETPITLRTVDLGSADDLVALNELASAEQAPEEAPPPVESSSEEEEVALETLAPDETPPAAPVSEEEVALETLAPSETPPSAETPEEEAALAALGPSEPPPAQASEEDVALEALGPSETPPPPAHTSEEEAALGALGPSETPPEQASEEDAALGALGPSEVPPPPAPASEEESALESLAPSEVPAPPAPASEDEAFLEALGTTQAPPPPEPSPSAAHAEPEPGIALPFGDREKVWTKTTQEGTRRRPPPAWSLSGDLKVTSVPRLLNAYYEARHSGELKLRQASIQKVIYFEAGRPVYAASNLAPERFLRFCVRRGLLPEAKAQQAAVLAREQNLRSGEALLRLGLLDVARREQLVTEQVKEIIASTLSWTEGAYGFSPMRPPRTGLVKLSVFPGDLILEGTLRTEHLVALRQRMPRSRRLFPSAAPPYGLHELTLTGHQALLLAYADGSKTVEDLLALTDLSERDVLATLRGLELSGVLEERRDEPGNSRRISFGL